MFPTIPLSITDQPNIFFFSDFYCSKKHGFSNRFDATATCRTHGLSCRYINYDLSQKCDSNWQLFLILYPGCVFWNRSCENMDATFSAVQIVLSCSGVQNVVAMTWTVNSLFRVSMIYITQLWLCNFEGKESIAAWF